jgi:hypothetical protein
MPPQKSTKATGVKKTVSKEMPKRKATACGTLGKTRKKTARDRGEQLDGAAAFCKKRGFGAVQDQRVALNEGKKCVPQKEYPNGPLQKSCAFCLQAASLHGPPGAPTVPRHPSPSPTYAPSPSLPLTPRAQVAVQRQRPRQERHR